MDLKKDFQALLLTGWIGLCAVALLAQTPLLFGFPPVSGWVAGFVFCGAVFGYYFTQPDPLRRRLAWALGLLGALCFLQMPVFARWMALVPLAVWGLYYGFRRPGNAGWRARPLVKPVAIASAWAWVTVLLPLEAQHWAAALWLVLGRTAFIFALALAYDLTDLDYDRHRGLPTLALQLGKTRTLYLFDAALLLSAACVGVNFFARHYAAPVTIALLISLAWSAVAVRRVLHRALSPGTQKFWIDGLMVSQFLLVWAAQYFFARQ